jgi:hypothetical protein
MTRYNRTLAIGVILMAIAPSVIAHEFFVSISKVKWVTEQQVVTVSVRVFTDNLQDGVVNMGGPQLNLWTENVHDDASEWVSRYILSKLDLTIDGVECSLQFQTMADALDATACLFHIKEIAAIETVKVRNEILTELIDDQANIVRFDIAGQKKFLNLNKKLSRDTVQF